MLHINNTKYISPQFTHASCKYYMKFKSWDIAYSEIFLSPSKYTRGLQIQLHTDTLLAKYLQSVTNL